MSGPVLPHHGGVPRAGREGVAGVRTPVLAPQQPDAGLDRQRVRAHLPPVPGRRPPGGWATGRVNARSGREGRLAAREGVVRPKRRIEIWWRLDYVGFSTNL